MRAIAWINMQGPTLLTSLVQHNIKKSSSAIERIRNTDRSFKPQKMSKKKVVKTDGDARQEPI